MATTKKNLKSRIYEKIRDKGNKIDTISLARETLSLPEAIGLLDFSGLTLSYGRSIISFIV